MRRLALLQPATRIAQPSVRFIGDRAMQKKTIQKKSHNRRSKAEADAKEAYERESDSVLQSLSQHRKRLWEEGSSSIRFLDNDDSWEHPLQILGKVRETPESVIISCNLPKGFQPENVNVRINGNTLEISGRQEAEWDTQENDAKKQDTKEKKGLASGHAWGKQTQTFQRRVRLPSGIKADTMNTNFIEDVLEVTLKKPQAPGTQQLNEEGQNGDFEKNVV
jgi:HSP20 family molecular chaperone IbpA